jgi:hypothetical protein
MKKSVSFTALQTLLSIIVFHAMHYILFLSIFIGSKANTFPHQKFITNDNTVLRMMRISVSIMLSITAGTSNCRYSSLFCKKFNVKIFNSFRVINLYYKQALNVN